MLPSARFVYALHPFPSGNNFRFDTDAHYNEDLAKLKAKFKQVIDAGVRQIAILADDFVNPGAANEVRLLNDMSTWLAEVKQEYPDMKMTLPSFRMIIWEMEVPVNFRP